MVAFFIETNLIHFQPFFWITIQQYVFLKMAQDHQQLVILNREIIGFGVPTVRMAPNDKKWGMVSSPLHQAVVAFKLLPQPYGQCAHIHMGLHNVTTRSSMIFL